MQAYLLLQYGELLKKPVGKAAYFTNIFSNFAGINMRKYETI